MTGQDLKNSILQLAIQGKLVPQDANDEPASVLLERIKAEKQKLIKEKKIKKEKPLPEITEDEKPFEIPETWEWVRLEDIAFVGTGSTPDRSNSEYYGGTIPWVNSSLTQNDFICDTPECITEKAIEETSCRIYPIGTLIVAMYGQGKTRGQVSELKIVAATNQACAAINVYESNINSYVKLFFKYNYTTIRKEAAGGAQPNLNLIKIKKIFIPLPPLSEQHRIVAKIEELMPLVEEYDKAQKELDALNAKLPEALKKSILQEAIQGKLIPQDPNDEPASVLLQRIRKEKEQLVKDGKLKKKDLVTTPISDEEKPFDIPESWEWCRMGDFIRIIGGTSYSKGDITKQGIRILRGGNIQNTTLVINDDDVFVSEKLIDSEKNIIYGDTIIVASTGSFTAIGKPAFIDGNYEYTQIGAFLRILRPYCVETAKYLRLIFMGDYYRKHLKSKVKGTNINNIKSEYIDEMLVPLPPLAEQHRIVSKIEDLFAQIEPLAKALSTPM